MAFGAPRLWPRCSEAFDDEAELMFILDNSGRRIPEDQTLGHALGFITFNDGSVRDDQNETYQWTSGEVIEVEAEGIGICSISVVDGTILMARAPGPPDLTAHL